MMALADRQPAMVIDTEGMPQDRPGFSLELDWRDVTCRRHLHHRSPRDTDGHARPLKITQPEGETTLAPGSLAVPPGLKRQSPPP